MEFMFVEIQIYIHVENVMYSIIMFIQTDMQGLRGGGQTVLLLLSIIVEQV